MKVSKITLLLLVTLAFSAGAYAKVVDQNVARKAAKNYLFNRLSQNKSVKQADLDIAEAYTVADEQQLPYYHAFNFKQGGFVIITADDDLYPVIGYSTTGSYNADPKNCCFNSWMDQKKDEITYYRNRKVKAGAEIQKMWADLLDDNYANRPVTKDAKDIEPLIMSQWDQGKYYNTLCPVDAGGLENHVVTGCVATSMAQAMFYYRYPQQGQGSHGYTANNPNYGNYGWQFADFANTVYKWDEMVCSPTEANLQIAQLMYHCGISVNMSYGPQASGSFTNLIPSAMAAYFKYDPSIQYLQMMNYSALNWANMIKANLDVKRPVIYSGRNANGGHAWMCDGYQVNGSVTNFHFNWGWSGSDDGYYPINNMAPGSEPAYSQDNSIVRNIYPASNYPEYCTGQKIFTGTKGTIDDGSGNISNYTDNSDCSYLIAPTDSVQKIILSFNKFSSELANDMMTVYDGDNISAPVLLSHSGDSVPGGNYTSTKNRMLITFKSNGSSNSQGFFATYKCIYPKYCQSSNYTAPSGTIADGSGANNYINNTTCSFTIQPPFGKNLNLNFSYFDVEQDMDYVKVYDLATQTLLNTFTGNTLPPQVTATSGSMYIEFKSNYVYTFGGWEANYSVGNLGLDESTGIHNLNIYPNPAKDQLHVNFSVETPRNLEVDLLNITGQLLQQFNYSGFSGEFSKTLDLNNLSKGVYMLRLKHDQGNYTQKIVIQ
ncbi:MAG: C10 family peptidase [Bacteroidetes bacterium]|nr:C10 family peptidase [Bacteroidota bacterium]